MREPALTPDVMSAFAALPAALQELSACDSVGGLLAGAAELARERCGFSRAVVLTLDGDWLTAFHTDALTHAPSDRLRRRVLAVPCPVRPGTEEDRILAGQGTDPGGDGELAARLELDPAHLYGLVAHGGTPLGLLVLDRDGPAPLPVERSLVSAYAGVVGVALRGLVVALRVEQLTAELRFLVGSVNGFMLDVQDAEMVLPSSGRHLPTFSREDLAARPRPAARVDDLLTARERQVAELLVEGRSNRAIAEALHLAPDTVKGYVTQVLRKLQAANRAEAVAQYMRLAP